MQEASNPRVLSHTEFVLLTARPVVRIAFIGAMIALIGAAQGFNHGWNANAFALIVGAILAFGGVALYSTVFEMRGRSWTAAALSLTGFVPFAFGCYLVFVRGFWNARDLFSDFSFGLLAASAAFVYLGYRMVYWTHKLSEIGEALRSGRMILSPKSSST